MILGKDDPVRMKGLPTWDNLNDGVECVEVLEKEDTAVEDSVTAFEMLIELVAQIDNANSILPFQKFYPRLDVEKMGLWPRIFPFLDSEKYELQVHAAWLIAACAQNNPEGAEHLYSMDTVPKMLSLIKGDRKGSLAKKCVAALSALFQCSQGGFEQFEKNNGLEILQETILRFHEDENLKSRAVFALYFYVVLVEGYPPSLRENAFFYPLIEEAIAQRSDNVTQ